jgi:signal transduction histidine kinase
MPASHVIRKKRANPSIQLRTEAVPLETCIDTALETAQPLIRERRHQLTVGRTRESVHVDADRVRLAQCLANLLTNAAKYTDVGGEIRISPHIDGDHAVIEVTDNGIGIAPDFLPQVFELFAQSDRSLDRAQGGLGIGVLVVDDNRDAADALALLLDLAGHEVSTVYSADAALQELPAELEQVFTG